MEKSLVNVPVKKIRFEKQVRESLDEARVQQMAQTASVVGIVQPPILRRDADFFVPIEGHYRVAAAILLGWETIRAIIDGEQLDANGVLIRQLITNTMRTGLKPSESAKGIEQLILATGSTAGEVAKQIGLSDAKVSDLRKLTTLSAEIIELVDAGKIPVSAAAELARREPAERAELARQLAEGKLTRDGLAGARRAAKRDTKPGKTQSSRVTAFLEGGRSITVSGDNLTLETFIEAIESLLTKARRARPQGIGLSTFIKMLKDQQAGGNAG